MKKIILQMDALTVETFATSDANGAAEALLATRPLICDPATVPPRCAEF